MSKSLEQMQREISELLHLIDLCDQELHTSSSHLREGLEEITENVGDFVDKAMSNTGVKYHLAQFVKKSVSSGRIQEIVVGATVGVALYATVWAGTAVIDSASNAAAKRKAKERMLSCYKELSAKHGMLVDKLLKLQEQQMTEIREHGAASAAHDEEIRRLKGIIQTLVDSGHLKQA